MPGPRGRAQGTLAQASAVGVLAARKHGLLWRSAAVAVLLLVVLTGWLMFWGGSPLRPAEAPALMPPPLPSPAAPQTLPFLPPTSATDPQPPALNGVPPEQPVAEQGPAFVPQSMPEPKP